MPEETRHEEFKVSGADVLQRLKAIVQEGNVRRILIKNEKDDTILEFPLTIGVVGAALIPVWAAIGAMIALVTNCTIVVERRETKA